MSSRNIIRTLSKLGFCSRKEALILVKSGVVAVNGVIAHDPGSVVCASSKIQVKGKLVEKKSYRYILLNKPKGYVTTRSDELGRKTVYDLLGEIKDWLSPVGRLDKDTEGLLIFTNDTKYGDYLTDPNNKVPRTYLVDVNSAVTDDAVKRILNGIDIGNNAISKPSKIKIITRLQDTTRLELTLHEGKNREVRRLFEALSMKVVRLVRISYGAHSLGTIPVGEWREVRI